MNKSIVTGIFAFTAMFATFAETAKAAEVLPDGKYEFTNKGPKGEGRLIFTLRHTGNDKYEIKSGSGYLAAASSADGAKVDGQAGRKGTLWTVIKNSNGYSFHHADNGANCLSITPDGELKLRRANAGGRGNADQLWQKK